MTGMLHFATLVLTTLFAVAAAFALDWMLLRAMFVLMRPAAARQRTMSRALARGTVHLTRAYAANR